LPAAVQEFFFFFICAACNFFSYNKRLQEFFFQNHPTPPPQELNGRPLKMEGDNIQLLIERNLCPNEEEHETLSWPFG